MEQVFQQFRQHCAYKSLGSLDIEICANRQTDGQNQLLYPLLHMRARGNDLSTSHLTCMCTLVHTIKSCDYAPPPPLRMLALDKSGEGA